MSVVPGRQVSVAPRIFEVAPLYRRIVVTAVGPSIAETSDTLRALFADSVAKVHQTLGEVDLATVSPIAGWRDTFRALGWSGSKFRSSIDALVRRAARGDLTPLGMALVDAGTIATLNCLVPIGVHVLDGVPNEPLELGPADGSELFESFEGTQERPDPGEVIYHAGQTVLTRRWVWRQGRVGSISGAAKAIAVNVDVLDPASVDIAHTIQTVEDLLAECGVSLLGTVELDAKSPSGRLLGLS